MKGNLEFEIGTIDFKHCDTKMINEKFAFKAKPQNFSVDFCLQRYCCCWWWWSFLFKVQLVHEKCCHEKLIEKCFKKYFNYHLISTYLFSFAIIHSTNSYLAKVPNLLISLPIYFCWQHISRTNFKFLGKNVFDFDLANTRWQF